MSQIDVISHYIDGKNLGEPTNWDGLLVQLAWERGQIQPSLSGDRLVFVGESRDYILEWLEQYGPYQGIPYKIGISNRLHNIIIFDGFLDLSDNLQFEDPSEKDGSPLQLAVTLKKRDSNDTFETRMSGLTAGYLESIGVYSAGDYRTVKYLIQKPDGVDPIEIALLTFMIYNTVVAIQDFITRTTKTVADITAHAAGGQTGFIAALAYAIVAIAVDIALTTIIVVNTLKLTLDVLEQIISPVRKHKGITFRTYLTKAAAHAGFALNAPISGLDFVILPTPPGEDQNITEGIPRASDAGYNLGEALDIAKTMFNAETRTVGNTVELRTKSDPYWRTPSNFTFPDNRLEVRNINTDDLVANTSINFDFDVSEEWTVERWKGTNYVVSVSHKALMPEDLNLIKGRDEINIPYALGNRKNSLNALEKVALNLAETTDSMVEALGGKGKAAGKIKDRKGMLILSSRNYSKPKILSMSGSLLNSNHRVLLSAKALYNDYLSWGSFVTNGDIAQKSLYNGVDNVPFRLDDFVQVISNPFFRMNDGRMGRMNSLEWRMNEDNATVDIEVEDRYTDDLQETFVEP